MRGPAVVADGAFAGGTPQSPAQVDIGQRLEGMRQTGADGGIVQKSFAVVADEYRDAIVDLWGRRALVSLALAITAARIYPTVKYALGHGKACMRVVVAGTPVSLDHGRVPKIEAVVRSA